MEQKYTDCDLQKYGDNLGQWFSRQYWKALEDISTTSAKLLLFKPFFLFTKSGCGNTYKYFFNEIVIIMM